jgi:hypothetical protein
MSQNSNRSSLKVGAEDDEKEGKITLVEDVNQTRYSKVYANHGRIDLDPMPSDSPADPLNWPS